MIKRKKIFQRNIVAKKCDESFRYNIGLKFMNPNIFHNLFNDPACKEDNNAAL